MAKRKPVMEYPEEIKQFIIANVKGRYTDDLANLVNEKFDTEYTIQDMKNFKKRYRLISGTSARYGDAKKNYRGMFNKGKHYSPKTEFKKGQQSHNLQPVGTVMKRSDGYWWKKVSDDKVPHRHNWKQLHRLYWENKNGPVPKGHLIMFLDGDRDNCAIDNLVLVTTQERLMLTRKKLYFEGQPELMKLGLLTARVLTRIYQIEKEKK